MIRKYLEEVARKDFGLLKKNEKVYDFSKTKPKKQVKRKVKVRPEPHCQEAQENPDLPPQPEEEAATGDVAEPSLKLPAEIILLTLVL